MASITQQINGRRILQFTLGGKRQTIRLGKVPQRTAETIKRRVEIIVAAKLAGHAIDDETATWLGSIPEPLSDKLAAASLIPHRERKAPATLGPFLSAYLEKRTDTKQSTREHLERTKKQLVEFFGDDKPLADITPGCADEFRLHLLDTMGDNTVRRLCGRAKQFFRAAARKRLIVLSPFGDMGDTNVRENKAREFFVSREMADKVLAACPDSQWRLLFALSRYGGLRCPSEHLSLTWGDVDWERSRMRVPSPKTEHHEGREF